MRLVFVMLVRYLQTCKPHTTYKLKMKTVTIFLLSIFSISQQSRVCEAYQFYFKRLKGNKYYPQVRSESILLCIYFQIGGADVFKLVGVVSNVTQKRYIQNWFHKHFCTQNSRQRLF